MMLSAFHAILQSGHVTPAVKLGNRHTMTGALSQNNEDLTCTASEA